MLKLLEYELYPEQSELLLDLALDSERDMDAFELSSGIWTIEDGALIGCYRGNGGGICYTKQSFPGDILIEFYASMIPPCNNDLNFVIKSEGWDYAKNDAARGFIGGLNGWYEARAGIEKYPLCATRALTAFDGESGREYFLQAGYVQDTAFLFADGRLLCELHDPNPEEFAPLGRIGLGTYCSRIRFRKLRALRIKSRRVTKAYTPNF